MINRRFRMKQIQETVEPEAVEEAVEESLRPAYPEDKEPVLQSQALIFHRFIRFNIDDVEQETLKSPEITLRDREGGLVDQIVLLASMCVSKGISCRILRVSNTREVRHTLEVLVRNETDVQVIGVDAEQHYPFRESKRRDRWFWTPADPRICRRTGDLETLEEKELIEKKSDGDEKYYDWVEISDRYSIWTTP